MLRAKVVLADEERWIREILRTIITRTQCIIVSQVERAARRALTRLEAMRDDPLERRDMRNRLRKLESLVTQKAGDPGAVPAADWRIQWTIVFLESNLAALPSLREVAEACFMSPGTMGVDDGELLARSLFPERQHERVRVAFRHRHDRPGG